VPVTRLGVAGLGWLGESLIKDAVRSPEFEVVAVQDVLSHRARVIADNYSVPSCHQDYAALLAQPEVDAVLICTPNHLHAQQAQLALRAGKDVLVQKPLALSASDARQTLSAAEAAGRLLLVDYTYRFLETMASLREALRSAGAVQAVRAAFHNIYGPGADKAWFFNPSTSGGGALMDLGVHLLDLGIWLVQPQSVLVEHVDVSQEQPVEQAARLSLRLDAVPFEVAVSWNAPLPNTQIFLELDTEAGTLRWENVDGSFFHFRCVRNGEVLLDRETTLREDTLRAFAAALAAPPAADVDTRVYEVLDQAYGRIRD
jgi:predicted dehydrogenase